jgi:transcriptional regulator with XRE-family HTH domain
MTGEESWWEPPDHVRGHIGAWRYWRGVTQAELAAATGISLGTIRRLDRDQIWNPGIRYLMNIAIALDIAPELIIDGFDEWTVFSEAAAKPPSLKFVDRGGPDYRGYLKPQG